VLPCSRGCPWIAHHEVSANNLEVDDGLALGLVFGVEEPLGFCLVGGLSRNDSIEVV
jgi:hypothetical protein